MKLQVFGIKNCDTVKKALKWLTEHQIDFEFYDFKRQPPTAALVDEGLEQVELSLLINKRGTTWRKLEPSQQSFDDLTQLKQLIIDNPTLLKRPLVTKCDRWFVGFNAETWQKQFARQ